MSNTLDQKFTEETTAANIADSDQSLGYTNTSSGGERRWSWATKWAWILLKMAAFASDVRTALSLGDAATKDTGTTAGTLCAGDDSRLSDSRDPNAHTHAQSEITGLEDALAAINALLTSDETDLDTLQEIVDFIQLNREDLDALGISSIAGLQSALDGKSPTSHTHSQSDIAGLVGDLADIDALLWTPIKRPLTITATATDRVYDSTTDVEVTISDDRVSGDDITITYDAQIIDKHVGTDKPVLLYNIELSGPDADKYYTSPVICTTATITPADLSISGITVDNKTYDGTTDATVDVSNATYTGLFAGDDVSVSAIGTFSDKNVYWVKVVTLDSSYTGADVNNYNITDQATTYATLSRADLSISGITAADKTYDGTTDAVLDTSGIVYSGLIAGDDVTATITGTFDTDAVGVGKVVTLSGSATGADIGNYNISYQSSTHANIFA